MSNVALKVAGLGKRYRLSAKDSAGGMYRYKSLRDTMGDFTKRPLSTLHDAFVRGPMTDDNAFWALEDVSFEVKKGEVIGIIGRNGAGKSTLLKILSHITKPTTGRVDLFGRVGSLLEVGTGFHPELSGRENIYLNGAILGMTRAEVRDKFDEIVAFSEIERFLDMPVKQYSSGMYTRLAFAVAAHLEPEILVVDEVLAVGDASFQRKCLGKMKNIADAGRTVLFVSHNMAAVSNLCSTAVVLENGSMQFGGDVEEAIAFYNAGNISVGNADGDRVGGSRRPGSRHVITRARVLSERGEAVGAVTLGSDIFIEMAFDTGDNEGLGNPVMGVVIHHAVIGPVGGINMLMTGSVPSTGRHRRGVIVCHLHAPPLLQGQYRLDLWLTDGETPVDVLEGVLDFSVLDADIYQSGRSPNRSVGLIYFQCDWRLHLSDTSEAGVLAGTSVAGTTA
jgi:lipopolysaccharide transport system ATP-binding protein